MTIMSRGSLEPLLDGMFQPTTNSIIPPEYVEEIRPAVALLKGESYEYLDPEGGVMEDDDHELLANLLEERPNTIVARWSGRAADSYGYGDITGIETVTGGGYMFSVGGSSGQSASNFWILPVGWRG